MLLLVVSSIISGPCLISFWDFHFDLFLKKTRLGNGFGQSVSATTTKTTITINNDEQQPTCKNQIPAGHNNNSKQGTNLKVPNTVVVYSAPGIDLCVKVIELLRSVLINTGKVTILVGLSWRGSPSGSMESAGHPWLFRCHHGNWIKIVVFLWTLTPLWFSLPFLFSEAWICPRYDYLGNLCSLHPPLKKLGTQKVMVFVKEFPSPTHPVIFSDDWGVKSPHYNI